MIFGTLEDEICQRNAYVIGCHVINDKLYFDGTL